jgi:hypothetical protein
MCAEETTKRNKERKRELNKKQREHKRENKREKNRPGGGSPLFVLPRTLLKAVTTSSSPSQIARKTCEQMM